MEAIIEKLLLIEDEQILMTPPDELGLPTRVYRSLRRGRVRTVGDLAQIWSDNRQVRNIGERARGEILGPLQAWSLAVPDFIPSQGSASVREAAVGRPPRSSAILSKNI